MKKFELKEYVKIIDKNIYGQIIAINDENITFKTDDGKNIICKKNLLEIYTPKKRKTNVTVKYDFEIPNTNFVNEIMLRHMHKEEAIETLDKFISDAVMNKEKKVKIVHGKHGGILREAVQEYLKNSKYIDKYELARIF